MDSKQSKDSFVQLCALLSLSLCVPFRTVVMCLVLSGWNYYKTCFDTLWAQDLKNMFALKRFFFFELTQQTLLTCVGHITHLSPIKSSKFEDTLSAIPEMQAPEL